MDGMVTRLGYTSTKHRRATRGLVIVVVAEEAFRHTAMHMRSASNFSVLPDPRHGIPTTDPTSVPFATVADTPDVPHGASPQDQICKTLPTICARP